VRSFRITPAPGRVAVLASGGLDSSVLIADLARRGRRVFPIYVRAGLKWERAELAMLRRFLAALGRGRIERLVVLDLPMSDVAPNHWSVTGRGVPGFAAALESNYILGRNLSLLAKAAIFCAHNRIGRIAIAALDANPFPDARAEFFRAVERAVALGTGLKLRVITPYAGMTKAGVIGRGRGLRLDLTLSCAQPRGGLHCGACTKCAERIEGFRAAGIADPARYARPPRSISNPRR
jgi:7-cyano-7-deazaguanine synthase